VGTKPFLILTEEVSNLPTNNMAPDSESSSLSTTEYRMHLPKDSSFESLTRLELKLNRQQSSFADFVERHPWLIAAWTVHFISSILILTYGSISKDGER
jgi:hypothetical protein